MVASHGVNLGMKQGKEMLIIQGTPRSDLAQLKDRLTTTSVVVRDRSYNPSVGITQFHGKKSITNVESGNASMGT